MSALLKKLALAAATDENLRKKILGVLAVVAALIVLPIVLLVEIFDAGSKMNSSEAAALLSESQLAEMRYFESVLTKISDEITARGLEADPIKAQVIFLFSVSGREKESETFYADFVDCFSEVPDDAGIFAKLSARFGVDFSAEEQRRIIEMYDKAVASQTAAPNSVHAQIAALLATDDTPASGGSFSSPFHDRGWQGCVTSGFGTRVDPITSEVSAHSGLDLAAEAGANIYAAKAGKVLLVRESGTGYGQFIAVSHGGGLATLYAHCSAILVAEGDIVTPETVIARVGSTGRSTGPHLHFEAVLDGTPVNPKKYLEANLP